MYTCVPAWYEMENYKSTTTHIDITLIIFIVLRITIQVLNV